MQASLCELIIEGVEHNADFHMELLDQPAFIDGSYNTGFLNGLLAAKRQSGDC